MGSEWSKTPIQELLKAGDLLINDGYRAKNSELSQSGVPFARAGNINQGFQFADADYFPLESLDRVGLKVSEPGDVVFTSKGTVGRFAFVKQTTPRFVYAPQLCFWRSQSQTRIDPKWLFYWMHGREFFHQYKSVAGQTDMAEYVSLRDQRKFHITLPQIEQQRAIASILGSLDDKIDLNRRMNGTLESIARAIFKSWFVDFDPVRWNAEGKPLTHPTNPDHHLPKSTAALFPSTFQDSEMGKIPTGWSIDSIKNRASSVQYGFTQSSTDKEIGPHFLRITDIRGGQVSWSTVPYCRATPQEIEKYRIRDGDIFVARTGASTGENTYVVEPPDAVFASYLVRFKFESRGIGRIVAEYMRSDDFFIHVAGSIGGSAQPNASAQTLASATAVFPSIEVANSFYEKIRPLDLLRSANERQSQTLAALRDALLPKLLSGELRVGEAAELARDAIG